MEEPCTALRQDRTIHRHVARYVPCQLSITYIHKDSRRGIRSGLSEPRAARFRSDDRLDPKPRLRRRRMLIIPIVGSAIDEWANAGDCKVPLDIVRAGTTAVPRHYRSRTLWECERVSCRVGAEAASTLALVGLGPINKTIIIQNYESRPQLIGTL